MLVRKKAIYGLFLLTVSSIVILSGCVNTLTEGIISEFTNSQLQEAAGGAAFGASYAIIMPISTGTSLLASPNAYTFDNDGWATVVPDSGLATINVRVKKDSVVLTPDSVDFPTILTTGNYTYEYTGDIALEDSDVTIEVGQTTSSPLVVANSTINGVSKVNMGDGSYLTLTFTDLGLTQSGSSYFPDSEIPVTYKKGSLEVTGAIALSASGASVTFEGETFTVNMN